MVDDAPWFRRYFGFSLVPITWKGRVATLAFLLVVAPLGYAAGEADAGSVQWWLLAAAMFAAFLAFWAFALSKTR